jgi:chaperonin GroEL
MMSSHLKTKTAAKSIKVKGPKLQATVLKTMTSIADIVGATLGPGGSQVLIERQEFGLPPLVTKDGVTVMTSLGFADPVAHTVMESARDAAVRTVSEAGDGTTTATVLAYALVKYAQEFSVGHPDVPPQVVVRTIQKQFEDFIVPFIEKKALKVNLDEAGTPLLKAVATISANGEKPLADAVMQCFDLVGDKGNVTLSEKSGPSGYLVEKVEGYPIPTGYEDSCGKFMTTFINDAANSRGFLTKPVVILYNGTINDFGTIYPALAAIQEAYNNRPGMDHPHDPNLPSLSQPGVVIVANGFGEQFLAVLELNWKAGLLRPIPVVTPRSALQNGEVHFLDDLAAATGATVFNPVSMPFEKFSPDLSDLGHAEEFEIHRFRSTIIGINDEDEVIDRADQLEGMAKTAISEMDRRLLQERLACLTGGIAKLFIVGSSVGDIKERKDRADDAIRAIQGALKAGVLPGGGWTLVHLSKGLAEAFPSNLVVTRVLAPALLEPFKRLLANMGHDEKFYSATKLVMEAATDMVYDLAASEWVDPYESGLLDSVPAVLEAIRNSISIATLLGTLGGVVVFERDAELERSEARAAEDFNRNSTVQESNERW